MALRDSRKKGTGPICATTMQAWCPPSGRSGKLDLSPFSSSPKADRRQESPPTVEARFRLANWGEMEKGTWARKTRCRAGGRPGMLSARGARHGTSSEETGRPATAGHHGGPQVTFRPATPAPPPAAASRLGQGPARRPPTIRPRPSLAPANPQRPVLCVESEGATNRHNRLGGIIRRTVVESVIGCHGCISRAPESHNCPWSHGRHGRGTHMNSPGSAGQLWS